MGCLQPHFDSPYLATSLRDFWGRRWNLTAANTLRFLVYEPILQGMPSPAASLAHHHKLSSVWTCGEFPHTSVRTFIACPDEHAQFDPGVADLLACWS